MSDKPTRSGLATLPEWPTVPVIDMPATQFDVAKAWHQHEHKRAEAALARMEALVEYARHKDGCHAGRVAVGHSACTCGLSELLAACERRKS